MGIFRSPVMRRAFPVLAAATLTVLGSATWASGPPDSASAPTMGSDCRGLSGAVQALATVTNTYDRDYHCLGVRVDAAANITAIRFETHRPDGRDTDREFTLAEIASDRGAVLDGRPGHDAVILRGHVIAGTAAAALTLAFLSNGLTGEYRSCGLRLERDAADGWHLLDSSGRRQSRIVIHTWGVPLVGTLGIDNVRGVCATPPKM